MNAPPRLPCFGARGFTPKASGTAILPSSLGRRGGDGLSVLSWQDTGTLCDIEMGRILRHKAPIKTPRWAVI